MLSSPVGDCYCAFCKSPRKYFIHKSLRPIHYVQAALLSTLLMYLIWSEFEARVFLIMAALLIALELGLLVRWRLYISCSKCGFDPVLYRKDPEIASKKVTQFMERYAADPQFELLPNPKKNLHHRRVPARLQHP
ncbi:MAG: hypothetical protein A4S09_02850 [Proteobacteria bacterium SG_bin7]|nr:MAG: hypothetical protein A4S09_02850 [Proteobacteria bacterium SG_bin7]